MKKLKQILVIVGLGSIASLTQTNSVGCPGTCPPGEHCSLDGNGGAGGCVPNIGTTHKTPTPSKEPIPSNAQTTVAKEKA